MKIYFTASVSAKKDHPGLVERYEKIVKHLEELGHKVMADHVLKLNHDFIKEVDDNYRMQYYKELLDQINKADLVFAELSYSSASIGHEVSLAIEKNKPVLIASESGRVPQIYKAMKQQTIYFAEYDDIDDLLDRLEELIKNVKEGEDIRFNFLIPPSMVDYLEWVSRTERIPKSVYLRNLIREELEKNEEYQA